MHACIPVDAGAELAQELLVVLFHDAQDLVDEALLLQEAQLLHIHDPLFFFFVFVSSLCFFFFFGSAIRSAATGAEEGLAGSVVGGQALEGDPAQSFLVVEAELAMEAERGASEVRISRREGLHGSKGAGSEGSPHIYTHTYIHIYTCIYMHRMHTSCIRTHASMHA
jgi:hypothetical protein